MSNNAPIPSGSAPNDIIAPYWFDLDPSGRKSNQNDLYVKVTSTSLVIEYKEVPHILSAQKAHFQIVLHSDDFVTTARLAPVCPLWT